MAWGAIGLAGGDGDAIFEGLGWGGGEQSAEDEREARGSGKWRWGDSAVGAWGSRGDKSPEELLMNLIMEQNISISLI